MDRRRTRSFPLFLTALVLIAASLACGRQAPPTATPVMIVATPTPAPVAEQPTTPPEPTSTPEPGGCTNAMEFLADVTVPDGTTFAPDTAFVKTWRVQNTGTCNWSGYRIVFSDGEPMGTPEQVIADTPTGQAVEISLEMTAPGGAGNYTGRWQVQSPSGAVLGNLTCVIVVEGEDDPSEPPTDDPTAEPPNPPGEYPDLTIAEASVVANVPTQPESVQVAITVQNDGDTDAGAFTVNWIPHTGWSQIGCSHDVDGLPAGSSVALDCGYTYPEYGEMRWLARVDSENEVDEGAGEENNETSGRIPIFADAPEPETVTLQSLPAEDGYVRGVTSGQSISLEGTIQAGDGTQDQAKQAFFSFDLTAIPADVTIESAVLDLSGHEVRGAPFPALGTLRVYHHQYGTLDPGDFITSFPNGFHEWSGPPGTADATTQVQNAIANSRERFKIRVQFNYLVSPNQRADMLVFPEGGPSLTVTYTP
jgi:hypothetical protein